MGDEEFETRIQNVLRTLSREQLEQAALMMARQLKREHLPELLNLRIVPEDLKRSG